MDMDNNSFEETRANDLRKEKVKNFHLNINQDDLAVGERYRELEHLDVEEETISSYSDDDVREQMERDSKTMLKEELREEKKQKKYIDRQNRRRFRIIWWGSVALVGIVIGLFALVGVNDMLAMNRREANTVTVDIPENPTVDDVGAVLKKKGVIKEPAFFKLYASVTKSDDFSQGTYDIKTNMDYEAIINYLQSMSNRTDTIKVTIPEGLNVNETAKLLVKKGVLSDTAKFLELCNSDYFDEDYAFVRNIKNADKRYYKLEGFLFPDTYECYRNEKPELTITRMLNDYEYRVYSDQNVEGYSKAVNIRKLVKETDYSLNQTLIIASIIQAEAANVEDMYNISSIIHNRLEYDVDYGVAKLSLDSTKYYPYRSLKAVPKNMRKSFKSTYDTYNFTGLPAGPICNPGMQAIMAAIYPNETGYLYFCHDKDGNPYYATTLYEQEANLAAIS